MPQEVPGVICRKGAWTSVRISSSVLKLKARCTSSPDSKVLLDQIFDERAMAFFRA